MTDWDHIDDIFTAHQLKLDTVAYVESKNPLFLWKIYQSCRRKKIKPPPWVLEYFDQVAGELIDLEDKQHDAKDIVFALRLDSFGQHSKIGRIRLALNRLDAHQRFPGYVNEFEISLTKKEAKEKAIERLAKEFDKSPYTIGRWIRSVRKVLGS